MKSSNYKIGIDLGGTKIEIILIDTIGREIYRKRIKTPVNNYKLTVQSITNLVSQAEESINDKATIGIGIPGKLSLKTNFIEYSNSTYLINKPLIFDLEQSLNRSIKVQNDANCFALSEFKDGAGKNIKSLFAVILGSGVGGGIIINGQLHEGSNSNAGEWGHNRLPWSTDNEINSKICYCGKKGCIETFLSGKGLRDSFYELTKKSLTSEQIVDLSFKQDPSAISTLELYEERLAKSLSLIINTLDPEMIVIGGGMSNIDRIYQNVPNLIGKYVLSDSINTKIVKALHGDSSGVRGAAWL
tara:strand:- start:4347 stop:5249 length:903 start_codon:yes stop_codon:yes gene_type:complete